MELDLFLPFQIPSLRCAAPDPVSLASQLTEQDGRSLEDPKAGVGGGSFCVYPVVWSREGADTAETDRVEKWNTRICSQGRLAMEYLKLEILKNVLGSLLLWLALGVVLCTRR